MNRQVWHPDQFHGTGPFDIKTGRQLSVKKGPTYTDVFSQAMVKLGKENPKLGRHYSGNEGGNRTEGF